MLNEPHWLPIEVVIEHNRLELAETGENHFVRDTGLLESALARPKNFFGYGEEDVVALAVALMASFIGCLSLEQISEVLPSYHEDVVIAEAYAFLKHTYKRLKEDVKNILKAQRGNQSWVSVALNALLLYPALVSAGNLCYWRSISLF